MLLLSLLLRSAIEKWCEMAGVCVQPYGGGVCHFSLGWPCNNLSYRQCSCQILHSCAHMRLWYCVLKSRYRTCVPHRPRPIVPTSPLEVYGLLKHLLAPQNFTEEPYLLHTQIDLRLLLLLWLWWRPAAEVGMNDARDTFTTLSVKFVQLFVAPAALELVSHGSPEPTCV